MAKKNYTESDYSSVDKLFDRTDALPDEEFLAAEPMKGVVTNVMLVNIRERPDGKSRSIGTLNHGDEVNILERDGEFWKIRTRDGLVGFLLENFCREV